MLVGREPEGIYYCAAKDFVSTSTSIMDRLIAPKALVLWNMTRKVHRVVENTEDVDLTTNRITIGTE
jgi:hypothetical protein